MLELNKSLQNLIIYNIIEYILYEHFAKHSFKEIVSGKFPLIYCKTTTYTGTMMNMTKEFLSSKIDGTAYTLDFPYELKQRYKKMYREDDDYCELINECLYEEGIECYYIPNNYLI